MELKFAPFTSSINPGFWSALTKLKLDVLGLKEEGINVHAYYENKFQPTVPTLLTLDWNAFDPGKTKNNFTKFQFHEFLQKKFFQDLKNLLDLVGVLTVLMVL